MKLFPLYLLLILSLYSCEDNLGPESETNKDEAEFAFGWSYGECGGDCATLYKFTNGDLFPDAESGYMPSYDDVSFQDEALMNTTALTKVKSLIDDFPSFLIETTEEIFGCPDCGDWGAIHVMLEVDGKERWWTLDNQIDGNPDEIQAWTKRVQELIIELGS